MLMGLCSHTDLYPGKVLTAQFLNNGLDAVVATGGAVPTDPKSAGGKGNIIKHDDDPLGRNVIIGRHLQHRPAGKIHKGLGLQKKQLASMIGNLSVKSLKLTLIDLTS